MPHGSAEKSNNEADGKAGAAAEAEARRLEELASDPAHGGKITPGSMREAQVALGLEKAGRLLGPVTRDPTGAADFIDGRGVEWDVKSFNSNFPPSQGGYELAASITKIGAELLLGEHVIRNTTNLSAEAAHADPHSCVGGKQTRFPLCWDRPDGAGEFGEGRRESMSLVSIHAEFVVVAAEVLDERVPGADYPC